MINLNIISMNNIEIDENSLYNDFISYEEARKSGKYNMIMDMEDVIKDYNITSYQNYIYIIHNYTKLSHKYLENYD